MIFNLKRLNAVALAAALLIPSLDAEDAFAIPPILEQQRVQEPKRNPEFISPPGLRARVEFWKSVFTKYGKDQVVIHHRLYPQVMFKVLDFGPVSESRSKQGYDKFKKQVTEQKVNEIKVILASLAQGETPNSPLARQIVESMKFLPGGTRKYSKVVEADLIRTQTGIKERYIEALKRSGRYLPIMESIFTKEYGLPRELTCIPFIESSFDYTAYSSVGAAGIWQFMQRTGRSYMTINSFVDERRDPIEATRAAARYLSSAYTRLGSWPLSITSYNHGVGGVRGKVRAAGTTDIVTLLETHGDRPFGFASGNFYPEFLAALEIHDDPNKYFPGIVLEPPLSVAQIKLTQPVSVAYLTQKLGISTDELKKVNYGIGSAIWAGRYRIPAGYNLKVPSTYSPRLVALRQPEPTTKISAPPASAVSSTGTSYKVRKGDTLIGIAKKFRTTIQALRQANGLGPTQPLPIGETILIKAERVPATVKTVAKPKAKAKVLPNKIGKKK